MQNEVLNGEEGNESDHCSSTEGYAFSALNYSVSVLDRSRGHNRKFQSAAGSLNKRKELNSGFMAIQSDDLL